MAINPGYFLGEAVSSFRRNWVMSLVAVTIIYISLLLVGSFYLTGALLNEAATSLEQKVSVSIFLKDGAASADVQTLQSDILKDTRVEGVSYVSKAQALERFKERTKNTPQLVEQLKDNPLPASLEVRLKPESVRDVKLVVDGILKLPVLGKVISNPTEDVKYGQKNVVDNLFAATGIVRTFVLVFVIMLLIVSLVLIGNTIRLAIYARRREIGIMRLVGASNWFIRTPFLMEGIIQSLIGAGLALFVILGTTSWLLPRVRDAIPFLPLTLSSADMAQISLVLLVIGIIIGLAGSSFALRRYLRV